MSSSESLSEKSASSDEEFKVTGHINKQMSLRGRAPKKYIFLPFAYFFVFTKNTFFCQFLGFIS